MQLKEYLDKEGLRYYAFANRLGISSGALTYILKRKRSPHLEMALKIEKITNGQVQCQDLVAIQESV